MKNCISRFCLLALLLLMTIQQEGHTKRVEAEKTLYQMENDLKKKLLETKI